VPELRELVEPALQEYKIVPGLRNENYCFRRQKGIMAVCVFKDCDVEIRTIAFYCKDKG